MKASRGRGGPPVGGGKRGVITGFSAVARRRLLQLIGSIRRDAPLPIFITLTFPKNFPTPEEAKKEFHLMVMRLKYTFPSIGLIWKLEPQDRGAPHFHLLAWGAELGELMMYVPDAWFEIAGQGDRNHKMFHAGCLPPYRHCVEPVHSWKGVWFYAAKYLGKSFVVDNWPWTGRFWGVINRGNIPFGHLQEVYVSPKLIDQALRYMRRYAHQPARRAGSTIFCDAEQWVKNLEITRTDPRSIEMIVQLIELGGRLRLDVER